MQCEAAIHATHDLPSEEVRHSFHAAELARGIAPPLNEYQIAPIVRRHAGGSADPQDFSGQTPFIRERLFSW